MDVTATTKYLPISPQKLRLVCNQVRGMDARSATHLLGSMPQKGAEFVLKAVSSALANAENNFEMDPGMMVISEIFANEGPRRPWRRYGARGRFKPIIRRTSHVTVVLSEREVQAEITTKVEEEG